MNDLGGGVEYVADGRGEEQPAGFYRQFSEEKRAAVKVVAMDMHGPGQTPRGTPASPNFRSSRARSSQFADDAPASPAYVSQSPLVEQPLAEKPVRHPSPNVARVDVSQLHLHLQATDPRDSGQHIDKCLHLLLRGTRESFCSCYL